MAYKINVAGCQQISFTSTGSTASAAVIGARSVVMYATKDCFINIAASPTAGTTGAANVFVPAGVFLELDTSISVQMKIAARGTTDAGVLYINTLVG